MGKLILKNIVMLALTLMVTNVILVFVGLGVFGLHVENIRILTTLNAFFWAFHYGSDLGKQLREMKDNIGKKDE